MSGEVAEVGVSVAAAGDGAGVAVAGEMDGDEAFSWDRVGEGELVAATAGEGGGATVGDGLVVGTAAEQAKPTTAATPRIRAENRFFTIGDGLLK